MGILWLTADSQTNGRGDGQQITQTRGTNYTETHKRQTHDRRSRRSPTCVAGLASLLELLHEHLADDDVVLVAEYGAEDHRHPVRLGLHVPGGSTRSGLVCSGDGMVLPCTGSAANGRWRGVDR